MRKKATAQRTTKIEVKKNGQVYYWKKITQQEYIQTNSTIIKSIQKQLKLLLTKT